MSQQAQRGCCGAANSRLSAPCVRNALGLSVPQITVLTVRDPSHPLAQCPLGPDGHYIVVRGRLPRAANPGLTREERQSLVDQLMTARSQVPRGQGCWASAGLLGGPTALQISTATWSVRHPMHRDADRDAKKTSSKCAGRQLPALIEKKSPRPRPRGLKSTNVGGGDNLAPSMSARKTDNTMFTEVHARRMPRTR